MKTGRTKGGIARAAHGGPVRAPHANNRPPDTNVPAVDYPLRSSLVLPNFQLIIEHTRSAGIATNSVQRHPLLRSVPDEISSTQMPLIGQQSRKTGQINKSIESDPIDWTPLIVIVTPLIGTCGIEPELIVDVKRQPVGLYGASNQTWMNMVCDSLASLMLSPKKGGVGE